MANADPPALGPVLKSIGPDWFPEEGALPGVPELVAFGLPALKLPKLGVP